MYVLLSFSPFPPLYQTLSHLPPRFTRHHHHYHHHTHTHIHLLSSYIYLYLYLYVYFYFYFYFYVCFYFCLYFYFYFYLYPYSIPSRPKYARGAHTYTRGREMRVVRHGTSPVRVLAKPWRGHGGCAGTPAKYRWGVVITTASQRSDGLFACAPFRVGLSGWK